MKNIYLAAICLFAAVGTSQATTVSGSVVFDSSSTLGAFGAWTVNFNSTDPGVTLQSVTINLAPTGLFLDTTFQLIAPGAILPEDFGNVSGAAATGFTSISPATAAGRDGATSFTLNFSDFGNGESFGFGMDVDECNNSLNPAVSLGCSLVTGAEFAGATATFNFGPGFSTTATFGEIPNRNDYDAAASFEAEIPEPSTWLTIGSALTALGVIRRRRQA